MSKFDEDVRDQTHDVMVGEVGVRSEFQRLQECSAAVACWMPDIMAKVNNEERRSMFWEACQLLQKDMSFTLWPPESSGVLRLWPEREAMLDQYDKLCDAICANEQPNWFDPLSLERVAASIEVQPEFRSPTTWHARRIFHRLRRRST